MPSLNLTQVLDDLEEIEGWMKGVHQRCIRKGVSDKKLATFRMKYAMLSRVVNSIRVALSKPPSKPDMHLRIRLDGEHFVADMMDTFFNKQPSPKKVVSDFLKELEK